MGFYSIGYKKRPQQIYENLFLDKGLHYTLLICIPLCDADQKNLLSFPQRKRFKKCELDSLENPTYTVHVHT